MRTSPVGPQKGTKAEMPERELRTVKDFQREHPEQSPEFHEAGAALAEISTALGFIREADQALTKAWRRAVDKKNRHWDNFAFANKRKGAKR